jgi:ubiquinone/menaquinone biosynthesis C-methylase UbiE
MTEAGGEWSASFATASGAAPAIYEEVFVPRLFEPFAVLLLDRLRVAPGEALLDVATGPGTLARLAAARLGPDGRVTGADISPAMLAVARAKPVLPGTAPVEYVESPAGALAVDDGAYDVVTCQQGLQFFPDPVGALREMRRAAKPGGRLGIAVWNAIEQSPFFDRLAVAVGRVLGDAAERSYRNGPWGMPDGAALAGLVREAGYGSVEVEVATLPVTFEGGPAQLLATLAAASIAPQVAALDPAGRDDLANAARDTLGPLTEDGAVRSTAATHIVTARAW